MGDAEKAKYNKRGEHARKRKRELEARQAPAQLSEAMQKCKRRKAQAPEEVDQLMQEVMEPMQTHDDQAEGGSSSSSSAPARGKMLETPIEEYECISDKHVRIYAAGAEQGAAEFTGQHLQPKEVFGVTQVVQDPNDAQRIFVRLSDGRGWVSNLSRKDDGKIVIALRKA